MKIDLQSHQMLFNRAEEEGLEFEVEEGKSFRFLPNLGIKYRDAVHYVKGLKILRRTPSGKSVDIRVKSINEVWNPETQSYTLEQTSKVHKTIRIENIYLFLEVNSYMLKN